MSDERDYTCPSCGSVLMECFGTDPRTGEAKHGFQCHRGDCYETFEAHEIIDHLAPKE